MFGIFFSLLSFIGFGAGLSISAYALKLPAHSSELKGVSLTGWSSTFEPWIEEQVSKSPELLQMKATEVKSLCSNWASLNLSERKRFWVNFLRAMSFAESTYKRSSFFIERGFPRPDHITKRTVISEGLLQLSYGSASTYEKKRNTGACDFLSNPSELHYAQADYRNYLKTKSKLSLYPNHKAILNPYLNLACGIEILYQLYHQGSSRENALLKSGARYWSTLRPDREGYARFKQEYIKNNEVCVIPGHRGGLNIRVIPTVPSLPPVVIPVPSKPEPTVLPPVVVTGKVVKIRWSELDAVLNEEVIRSLNLPDFNPNRTK